MNRKLASIQKIRDIRPIEGADKIELARVNNWDVVVAKDVGHKVGDLVIYCEIDSFLPIRDEFEFLRKTSYKKMGDEEGFRLKTIRMRGQISQGLLLPLKVLNTDEIPHSGIWEIGDDVTEILGIQKYEPPIPAELAGKMKGNFPSWGRKTDQERCQNLVNEIQEAIDNEDEFEVTIKLDGSSMSVGKNDTDFAVCSRNLNLCETDTNTFWKVVNEYNLKEKFNNIGNIMVSGELMGPGIQKNREKLKHHDIFVFDVFDVDSRKYLGADKRMEIVDELGLKHVPIIHKSVTLKSIGLNSIDEILKFADGPSLNSKIREGVVFKRTDGNFSFKAINNRFLIDHSD